REPRVLDEGGEHRIDASSRRARGPRRGAGAPPEDAYRMNARLALILVVLLAVLGGAALVYYQQERSRAPATSEVLGRPVLPDLKAAEVASIRIIEPKAELTLQRDGERWVIVERDNFPADL